MPVKTRAKSLQQLKIDAKREHGWPWPITHPNDERALLEGCYPVFEAAEHVRRFYRECLVLPRDGGGVKSFHLLDWWYRDVIAPLFGWKRKDGRRRFQKGFITTAKKSGKSTVLAGLPLYMIQADGEEEAEAYSAAVDRDQASIVFQKTLRACRLADPEEQVFRTLESKKRIRHEASGSWYEAISSDADSTEGKNPHLLIADEVHVWRDRQFFESLMYGDIVRMQPLFLMITTAGDDDESIGFEEYEAAKDLLNPNDPYYIQSTFAYIAEATDATKWDDPRSWLEAQPSLRGEADTLGRKAMKRDSRPPVIGRIGSLDKLKTKADEAKHDVNKQRSFTRYICNRWVVGVEDPWLDPDAWDMCGGEIPAHLGDSCWGGLDLSSSRDLTSLCLAFWRDDIIDLMWKFWCPEENLKRREDQWRVPLRRWVEEGWIIATPGNAIDYGFIRRDISGALFDEKGQKLPEAWPQAAAILYQLQEIAADPWNATELCEKELFNQDGITVHPHRQTYCDMNEPTKRFKELIDGGKLCHGDNPVATWMSRHVVVDEDANKNQKPNKKKSRQKIDGIVSGIMASGRAIVGAGNTQCEGSLIVY